MQIKAIKTRIFHENEDLISFILKYIKKIPENSVLVVTSKILALSEGRTREYKNEKERKIQKIKFIKEESSFAVKTKIVWLTIKDGMMMADAGIDESNAKGKLILLPRNSFKSAEILRKKLIKKFHLKNLGILITDSRLMPLRAGVVGVALGYAGFTGVKDYRGQKDIFGRVFKMSQTNIADSLATTAVVCMGEGKEQQPLAIITGAPVSFNNEKINKKELIIDLDDDIYWPLFKKFKNKI
ncbi:MAG TPA: coenzyme F420-0:L-glutamate ligase [Candidatus Paceibacterota bacterium]|jgi:coenzyme F420-0:L-glutamate ligase|nr:coenzyme F420-0:L-glutamate ligase [Candidatus Paceibacterota bacterium]